MKVLEDSQIMGKAHGTLSMIVKSFRTFVSSSI